MNFESKHTPLVALTLSASLLAGCTPEQNTTPPPDMTSQQSDLKFEAAPDTNFSVSSCETNPNSWASHIDSDPTDSDDNDITVGITETFSAEGYPNTVSGAKIRSLGGLAYEIITSDDKVGETTIIDLDEKPFAKVLDGGDGYDIGLSARLGDDGAAYFSVNCLPDFGHPSEKSPLEESPFDDELIIPLPPASPPTLEA